MITAIQITGAILAQASLMATIYYVNFKRNFRRGFTYLGVAFVILFVALYLTEGGIIE